MDIKFHGIIRLIDGENGYNYYLPGPGSYYGKTDINGADFSRKFFLPSGSSETIGLEDSRSNIFLNVITDNDITLTGLSVNNLVVKASQINPEDKKLGFFMASFALIKSNSLTITGDFGDANVELYIGSIQQN